MSIDPKILAQRQKAMDGFMDDHPHLSEAVEGMTVLEGSPKQVKWATTIRREALKLAWPEAQLVLLRLVKDSTWWIANKTITTTMKFKQPAPEQLADSPPASGRSTQPELVPQTSPTPAATVFSSCTGFAASVSRTPKQAEATILALLGKLYKPPVRQQLLDAARNVKEQAEFEVGRDLDAINKLLG